MNDRLRFRVWDKRLNRYLGKDDPTPMLMSNGNLAYLDDEGMKFYKVEKCADLKDKKGILVYEGDILEVKVYDWTNKDHRFENKIKTLWVVEYKNYSNQIGFMVFGKKRQFHKQLTFNALLNAEAVIVGNIHENKDLLK